MSKNFILSSLLALLIAGNATGQVDSLYSGIHPWAASPVLHRLPPQFKDQSAVFLMDSRTFHYKFEGKNLVQLNYVYRLIKVEDDKGIEMFNKIYLAMSRNAQIYDIRARVITSSGTVINVPPGKIKEEEEDGRMYKLFAMEGIDKGSEIEYSYVVKQEPSFFGSEIFQSKAVPYFQVKLLIITPRHLKFEAKGLMA